MDIRFRHRVEYGALRALAGLFRALPYRLALAVAWGFAAFGHYAVRFRRREARRRVRAVLGPGAGEATIRRAAWTSWRNLCFNAVEIARLPVLDEAWMARHTLPAEYAPLLEAARSGRGAVLAVPHAGNWDLSGIVAHRLGVPVFFIARRQKNPLTDAYLNRMRGVTGVRTVLNDQSVLRGVIRNLKEGRCLAILPDVRARTASLTVRFLGGEAHLAAGMAMFARQTGVPILPCLLWREGWTRHRLRALDPVWPDPARPKREDWQRMTQAVLDAFDRHVREQPGQYFWYNKRWVLDPLAPSAPAEVGGRRPDAGPAA